MRSRTVKCAESKITYPSHSPHIKMRPQTLTYTIISPDPQDPVKAVFRISPAEAVNMDTDAMVRQRFGDRLVGVDHVKRVVVLR